MKRASPANGRSPAPPAPAGHVVADQGEVFAFLQDPRTHGLEEPVKRIDTHAAAVFLAGPDAYKVKRAVRFPFLDFGTLEKRRAACEAEVAVNRPNAPGLYLGVVAIRHGPEGLTLGGAGEAVEWAVHMRRFDENATLDKVAAQEGGLSVGLLRQMVEAVLASHAGAPARDATPAAASLARYIAENRAAFAEAPQLFPPDRAEALCDHAAAWLERVRPLLLERGRADRVRRCHGDLHLRNIALIDRRPVLFDAVEFDESIATGDVLYDLAFLLMDLWERGFREAANVVLNRYLWASEAEELKGLAALPLFLSLRAAIRAKVTAANLGHLEGAEREAAAGEARRYFDHSEAFLATAPARLVAVGGLSGTGKSTLAARLAPQIGRAPGAVHLRSDVERKRLLGVEETGRLPPEAYRTAVTDRIYRLLRRKACLALAAGQSVVADAVHGRPAERRGLERVAAMASVPFTGLWLDAPLAVLVGRVEGRRLDASDATAQIVRDQAVYCEPPADWLAVDASGSLDETTERALAALKRTGGG